MASAVEAGVPAGARVPAIILMSGAVGQALLFGVVAPALPALAVRLGAQAATVVPLIFALPSLGLMIAGFLAGPTLERIGPRNGLILGLAGFILFGSLPSATIDVVPLLASRLLLGIACGYLTTSATVLLVVAHEGDARSRMLGFQTAVGSIVGLVALVAAGALVAQVSWRPVFLIYGICLAPMLAVALVAVPDIRPASQEAGSAFIPTLARNWPVYVAACLLFVVPVAFVGQTPFLLVANDITSPVVHSILIGLANVGSGVSGAAFGRVHAALGSRRLFALALACSGVALVIAATTRSPVVYGFSAVLNGLGIGLFVSYLWLATARLSPETMRPRGLALLSTAMFLGGFLYPAIFGALAYPFGAAGGLAIMGATLIAGAIAAMVLRRGRLLVN